MLEDSRSLGASSAWCTGSGSGPVKGAVICTDRSTLQIDLLPAPTNQNTAPITAKATPKTLIEFLILNLQRGIKT